jgi:hypothetical protein
VHQSNKTHKEKRQIMAPTFGLFDIELTRKSYLSADDQERAGYLSEVARNSTQFGVGRVSESEARARSRVEEASLYRF